jgi:hypothetical protein
MKRSIGVVALMMAMSKRLNGFLGKSDFLDNILARLSALQAARQRVSTNQCNKVTGVSVLSEPDRDVEELGGDLKTRRTAAIASLKVGWRLLYHAA